MNRARWGPLLAAGLAAAAMLSAVREARLGASPLVSEASAIPPRTERFIVELSEPPEARAGRGHSLRNVAAGVQRQRVRDLILATDRSERIARGLSARGDRSVISREFGVVFNGFAVQLSRESALGLRDNLDVVRVVPDRPVWPDMDESVPLVRAPAFWNLSVPAYRGAGTRIAVIDDGLDYTHEAFGSCTAVGVGPNCRVMGGYDFADDDGDPLHGGPLFHGTAVAGVAAGNATLIGVAPEADLLAYRIFGSVSTIPAFQSVAMAAIEQAVADEADVIIMSFGAIGDEHDPLSTAVDNASAMGAVSVVSAGNDGSEYFSIQRSPASAATAVSVANTTKLDSLAGDSSRGPSPSSFLLKPEIAAPGKTICTAFASSAPLGLEECIPGNTMYTQVSGTSFSAPHVGGAAALALGWFDQVGISLTPGEVKAILVQAAVPAFDLPDDPATGQPYDLVSMGAGRLDVRSIADIETILTPAPINLGNDDNSGPSWVATADVEIRNLSAQAKTYALQVVGFPAAVSVDFFPGSNVVVNGSSVGNVQLQVTVPSSVADTLSPPYVHGGWFVAQSQVDAEAVPIAFAKRSPPDNDHCVTATAVAQAPFVDLVDMRATDPVETTPSPSCGCDTSGASVWYSYAAPPVVSRVRVSAIAELPGIGNQTVVSALTGSCASLTEVACQAPPDFPDHTDPTELKFIVSANTQYKIRAANECNRSGGDLSLQLDGSSCFGDCDFSGSISIGELIGGVNLSLQQATASSCVLVDFDSNQNGVIQIHELIRAIRNKLDGCAPQGGGAQDRSAGSIVLQIDASNALPGQTVSIPVTMSGASVPVAGVSVDLLYDSTVLELDPDSGCALSPGMPETSLYQSSLSTVPAEQARHRVLILDLDGEVFGNGELFQCAFTVAVNAPPATYPIVGDLAGASDPDGNGLLASVTPGQVNVVCGTCGCP